VEHPLAGTQGQGPAGGGAPQPVLAEGQHRVGHVVAPGDRVEHRRDLARVLGQRSSVHVLDRTGSAARGVRPDHHSVAPTSAQTTSSTEPTGTRATVTVRPATRTRSGSRESYSTSMCCPRSRFVGYSTPARGLRVTPSGVTKVIVERSTPGSSTSAV